MEGKHSWTNSSARSLDEMQALVEGGRRLHNQALLALLDWAASAVTGGLKQIFSQAGGGHGLSTPAKGAGTTLQ